MRRARVIGVFRSSSRGEAYPTTPGSTSDLGRLPHPPPPGGVPPPALPDERRDRHQADQEPVDRARHAGKRAFEVDEEDHAVSGAVVPGLVLVRVVEDEAPAL